MAYSAPHLLLRILGNFGGNPLSNEEKWSTSMRFGIPGGTVPYDSEGMQTFLNAAATPLRAFHVAAGSLTGSTTYLTELTLARIGTNGRYDPLIQETLHYTAPTTQGSGTPVLPWSTAIVFSLRTAIPRGYSSNGRVYWPATAAALELATGRLTAAQNSARVALFKTALDSVNAAANAYTTGMRLVVASSTGAVTNAVTSIRSDDRLDSIERRENARPSVWASAPLA